VCEQFIPNVGAIVATMLPVPLLLISPGVNVMQILLAVLLPTLVHVVVGQGIEPKVTPLVLIPHQERAASLAQPNTH
jgi:predicted PurR-regulated permease PerM